MEHYLDARQRSFVDQVSVRPIVGLCKAVTQQPEYRTSRIWWWTQTPLWVPEDSGEVGRNKRKLH
jgi:hypothetical protein